MAEEYSGRAYDAVQRVLIDLAQVLASFEEELVIVGGLVPSLLFPQGQPPHLGTIDVDIVLDARKLIGGRYAEALKCLLETGRYSLDPAQKFRFNCQVDLQDGRPPLLVPVEFLTWDEDDFKPRGEAQIEGFRILNRAIFAAALKDPVRVKLSDRRNLKGSLNTVSLRVANPEAFVLMKTDAIKRRAKSKDAYDIIYLLEQAQAELVTAFRQKTEEHRRSLLILAEKFKSPEHIGAVEYAEFKSPGDPEAQAYERNLAFSLVQEFLNQVDA